MKINGKSGDNLVMCLPVCLILNRYDITINMVLQIFKGLWCLFLPLQKSITWVTDVSFQKNCYCYHCAQLYHSTKLQLFCGWNYHLKTELPSYQIPCYKLLTDKNSVVILLRRRRMSKTSSVEVRNDEWNHNKREEAIQMAYSYASNMNSNALEQIFDIHTRATWTETELFLWQKFVQGI